MIEDPRNDSALTTLAEDFARSRVSRRQFLARAAALGVSASAAAGLLAAATPRLTLAQDEEPQLGGRFTWGYDRDVNKLDPVASGWADPGYTALYEFTMVRHPDTGLPVAALAESWVPTSPYVPLLRAQLRTGRRSLWLQRDLSDPLDPGAAGHVPLWSPPGKIAARRLGALLATRDEPAGLRLAQTV